jgi:hypothetical protein
MQIRYPLAMAAWTTLSAIAYAQPTGDQNYRLLPAKEPPTAPFYAPNYPAAAGNFLTRRSRDRHAATASTVASPMTCNGIALHRGC